jgi:hypothetical protein
VPKRTVKISPASPEFPTRPERREHILHALAVSLTRLDERLQVMATERKRPVENFITDWLRIPRVAGDEYERLVTEWAQGNRVATCGALVCLAAVALHMAEDAVLGDVPGEELCPECGDFHGAAEPH